MAKKKNNKKKSQSLNTGLAVKAEETGAAKEVEVEVDPSAAVINAIAQRPFVSVCTPTFNRRPFIPAMLRCYAHQDYPKDRMEWIIVDDGTDKIGDLVAHIPGVKYYALDTQLPLGAKRNLLHAKSCGDIIVYMDDDDYYPPERVSHAVHMLETHPTALCAGSSILYIHFRHLQKIYKFGPYGPQHATAGTMAFRRALLADGQHRYDDTAALAEEKAFLKNYTVPFVQLDSLKTILVFSHDHNTFDKKRLLLNPNPQYVRESPLTVADFIRDEDATAATGATDATGATNASWFRDFYCHEINTLLVDYKPGRPNMKPEVLKQMVSIEKSRRLAQEKHLQQHMAAGGAAAAAGTITFKNGDGPPQTLTMPQVVAILQQQQQQLVEMSQLLMGKEAEIRLLQQQLSAAKRN
jgi:hypothetical protein